MPRTVLHVIIEQIDIANKGLYSSFKVCGTFKALYVICHMLELRQVFYKIINCYLWISKAESTEKSKSYSKAAN